MATSLARTASPSPESLRAVPSVQASQPGTSAHSTQTAEQSRVSRTPLSLWVPPAQVADIDGCRRVATAMTAGLRGPDRDRWLARLRSVQADMRRAVAEALRQGNTAKARSGRSAEPSAALLLVADLWWGWFQLGQVTEIRAWLDSALSSASNRAASPVIGRAASLPGPGELARIEARLGSGWLAHLAGESDTAESRLMAAVAGARAARAWRQLAIGLSVLSQVVLKRHDTGLAVRLAEESLELSHLAADPWGRAFGLGGLGDALRLSGQAGARAGAAQSYADALESAQVTGDPWLLSLTLANLAEHGGPAATDRSRSSLLEECLALAQSTGERSVIARSLAARDALAAGTRASSRPLNSVAIRADGTPRTAPIAIRRDQARHPAETVPAGSPARPAHTATTVQAGPDWVDPVAAGDESLRVHAFAPHAIVVNGRAVDSAEWRYSKPRELLFFLLDFPGATKDQIGAALWPDATSAQIRGSFHVALHHLRRVLGDAGLVTHNRGRYSLRQGLTVWYDVSVFEAQLDAATTLPPSQHEQAINHLGAAIDIAAGQFLPDIDGDWATARRNELQWRLDDALQSLADLLLAAGREQEAAEIRAQGKARIAARNAESGPAPRPAHTIRVPNSHARTDPDQIARLMSSPTPSDPNPSRPRLDAWRQRGSA